MTETRGEARVPAAPSRPRSAVALMLRGAVAPAAALGLTVAAGFGVLRGADAGASAALGAAIGVCFFASGLVLLAAPLRRWPAAVSFVIAVTLYGVQVGALLAAFEASGALPWLDGVAVGVDILAVVLGFQLGAILTWRRSRTPIYDETAPAGAQTPRGGARTPSD